MKLINLNSRPISIFDDMNRVMNTVLNNNIYKQDIKENWLPAVDVNEDSTSFTLTADMPGLNKSDIDISVEDNMLRISGDKEYIKTDKDVEYHYHERNHGKFFRSFKIPLTIDEKKISAVFKNGVLTIIMPKTVETQTSFRSIKVK